MGRCTPAGPARVRTFAAGRQPDESRDAWLLPAVFALAVATRLALAPLGHGQDFVVWDKATLATLRGDNIYAHHPDYPGGPFAYVPLFLYVELPFRWLALHTGLDFTVLGKLPVLAGDLAAGWLIADEVEQRGGNRRAQALGAALFLLNPLVLYDGAWYGRFDGLACALLLAALRQARRRGAGSAASAGWYALAVAAKTFPAFALAGMLRAARGRRLRAAAIVVGIIALLSGPYLLTLHAYVHDVVLYDAAKTPQGLSWQTLVPRFADAEDVRITGYVLLAGFAIGTLALTAVRDLDRYVLLTVLLFLCCSKVVLDQYLTWPLPWLAMLAVTHRARIAAASAGLLATLTVIGMFDNATIDPFGRSPAAVVIVLTLACASYIGLVVAEARRDRPALPLPDGTVTAATGAAAAN